MDYRLWIFVALLVILGVPFLFQGTFIFLDSKLRLELRFYFWSVFLWEKSFTKDTNETKENELSVTTKMQSKGAHEIKAQAPIEEPTVSKNDDSKKNKAKHKVEIAQATSSDIASSPNNLPSPEKFPEIELKPEPNQGQNLTPKLESKLIDKVSSKLPAQKRILRALIEITLLRKFSTWTWVRSFRLMQLFHLQFKTFRFEMCTQDPMLLAKIASTLGALSGVFPFFQKGSWTILFGPSAFYFRGEFRSSWNLGQVFWYLLWSALSLPWWHAIQNWRKAKESTWRDSTRWGEIEVKIVELIWNSWKSDEVKTEN